MKISRAGFWHKFHDLILIHKIIKIINYLDIYQVQYMPNFLKEKNLLTNAVKYTWYIQVSWFYITITLKVKIDWFVKITLNEVFKI